MTRQLSQHVAAKNLYRLAFILLAICGLVAAFVVRGGQAATPASGTVTTANTPSNPLIVTGGPYAVPNPSNFVNLVCANPAAPCDDFALDVDLPDGLQATNQVRVALSWGNSAADFDMAIYRRNADGSAGAEVTRAGTSSDPEIALLPAVKASYVVRVIPFAPLNQTTTTAITVEPKASNFVQGTGVAPQFRNYAAPNGLGTDAGEPSLGVNWKTGNVMMISDLQTLRVTFDQNGGAAWKDVSGLTTSAATTDPILWTDSTTGRTIVSQLAGTDSLSAFTDDDGNNWTPTEGGPLTSGVDHQTVGGGVYHTPIPQGVNPVYPHAVYYCSQDLVTAFCARSDDGGLTFGPTIPMFLQTCGGIHGHVKVGPDGTVYVPNRSCGSNQGLLVSEDNGITWNVRIVADNDPTTSTYDSISDHWDPAVGVGAGGTVYFGYDNGDGTAHVAVSRDQGRTWTDQNVGKPFGIIDTAFPAMVAGDDNRAAFAFLGSQAPSGSDAAIWHLYVATTYDGGNSWITTDATPNDPVQRGTICFDGFGVGACAKGDRNLLDFMDVTVDKAGRVLVGYADGCVGCTSPGGSRSKLATIARQTCGRRLFAKDDPTTDDCAAAATPTPTPVPTPTPATGAGCIVPGLQVVSDAVGDQTGGSTANQQQDIESISIAEQYPNGRGQLVVTMKLNQLDPTTMTPNGSWTTLFNATHADGTSTTYFVGADNNSLSNPAGLAFNYGFVDTTNQNLNTTVAAADAGVVDAAKRTITITLALDKLKKPVPATGGATLSGPAVDLSAGKSIVAINGRTSLIVGALGTGLIQTVDSTANGEYTFNGQAACSGIVGTPTPTPTGTPAPTPNPALAPRYTNYTTPSGVAESAGEPSVGVNWRSERSFSNSAGSIPNGGTVTYFGGFLPYMLRATFDDSVSPAAVLWDQAPLTVANAPRVFGDPILFTDHQTGRTFVSQELGLTPLGSTMEWTDDDGRSFKPSMGSGAPSGIDHQTVGGGPYHQPLNVTTNPVYPNSVYYCSQALEYAVCSLSVDGGTTFGPAVPIYTFRDCGGIHGHVKVAPDGTVYVPNRSCNGEQGVAVSEDNGITWKVRHVTGSTPGDTDPSVGIGADGTVYFGYETTDFHARISVSHDKGLTWTNDTDAGAPLGINSMVFPEVVAGDADRAAFAFLGSTTPGNYNDDAYKGVFYLIVATTFDGGKTWTTVNATPGDPVQRGRVCTDGINCTGTSRNLLDFFDISVDKEGRAVIGYVDGCVGACVQAGPNTGGAKAVVARQSGGQRLFARFDPPATSAPGAPAVAGSVSGTTASLTWSTPDNGGSAITGYKIARRDGATVTPLATVTTNTFSDPGYNATTQTVYRVTALNANGESAYKEFNPAGASVGQSPCTQPGVLVVSDVNSDGTDLDGNQNTPPDPRVNIKALYVAEPYMGSGVNKLVFTLKVGASTLGPLPPSSQWYIIWNRPVPDANFDRWYVAMKTDATGTPTFEYGKFGIPTNTSTATIPPPQSTSTNQSVKLGDADGGSFDPLTGTITITLSTSKAENVTAGKTLSGMNARTFFARPDAGLRSQNVSSDITGDGSYRLVGNSSCTSSASFVASPLP
jgi:hypothetical protein